MIVERELDSFGSGLREVGDFVRIIINLQILCNAEILFSSTPWNYFVLLITHAANRR